jgi:hypothetical protein
MHCEPHLGRIIATYSCCQPPPHQRKKSCIQAELLREGLDVQPWLDEMAEHGQLLEALGDVRLWRDHGAKGIIQQMVDGHRRHAMS